MRRTELEKLLRACRGKRVAVVGDLMLDRYIWGRVDRISPEAPVPVVSVERTSHALGGSANVVHNLRSLGAEVLPVGVIGPDAEGEQLRETFAEAAIPADGILVDSFRPTTVKTRVIAHDQHVVRVDSERTDPLGDALCGQLLEVLRARIDRLDAVIFQDYDKGVLQPELIRELRELCRDHDVYTAVDPKFRHFDSYGAVDLFKPNEKELGDACGRKPSSDEELEEIGKGFRKDSGCRELVVTRGSRGMISFSPEGTHSVPALSHAIVDVSGAGDTVISCLVLARLAGASVRDALWFASLGAACSCQVVGAVPVRGEQLLDLLGKL